MPEIGMSAVLLKTVQIYGLVIVISMAVTLVIKLLVVATSRLEKRNKANASAANAAPHLAKTAPKVAAGISPEIVAVISAAVAASSGASRILHIAQSGRSWVSQARSAQHSHQPNR